MISKRFILVLALALAGISAKARDYVITYTTGGTTYYLGMNGNSLASKTTFDPTCVWTCYNGNNEANLANNTSYSLRNKNNSSSYLTTSCTRNGSGNWWDPYTYTWSSLTVQNSASNLWRSSNGGDGNVYAYFTGNNWNRSASIHVNTLTMQDNNTTDSKNYQVTVTTVNGISTDPVITSGNDVLTATTDYTYTASAAAFQVGFTNYRFNNVDHYFDENGNSITVTGNPSAANISYGWSLSPTQQGVAVSGNSTTGTVTVSALPENDVTLTLTVTATATGGNPAAPAGTTLTGNKTITVQGTYPSAPVITVSGTTVTLSTNAAGTTTIRYTLDGTDPTATTGTVYNGTPIDLSGSTTSPITIKAVTVRNGIVSAIASEEVTLTLPEPVITADGSAGTATITCSNTTATIYYTLDGSEPTTSSNQYSGNLTGLNLMTTIKAIAVKEGWNNSTVASTTLTLPSGVSSDGVVTLFDYEPHSWSYYSDATNPVRSLNPADVKITYLGNGTNTVATSNGADPGNTFTASTNNAVKVGIDANADTFIYYKTLERVDGSTSSTPTGRCAYTTIPNPFSVRPTIGTGNNRWRGFYAWRVKSVSGGTIYNAATGGTAIGVNGTINAETEVFFAPDSEYGMEVELEALWARAFVFTTINDLNNAGNNAYVADANGEHRAYERNFVVVNANVGNTANNRPATISCLNPDGSGNVVTRTGVFTLNADTKFEYINLNNDNGTFIANNHYLCFGRGISTANRAASWVRGMAGTGTNNARLDYTIRMESGAFTHMTFLYHSPSYNNQITFSGVVSVKSIMGCDYDRATGNDESLLVGIGENTGTGNNQQHEGLFYSLYATLSNSGNNNNDNKTFDCVFKSGEYLRYYWDHDTDGNYDHNIYCGLNSSGASYPGQRYVTVEGGQFPSMNGGRGTNTQNNFNPANLTFVLRIKGGVFNGSVFGGAADNNTYGGRRIVVTGGRIRGWIAGGCNGTGTGDGGAQATTNGDSYIYVGGNALVGSTGDDVLEVNETVGGQVFGAGRGKHVTSNGQDFYQEAKVTNSYVVIADNAIISSGTNPNGGNVYGGGNLGSVETTSNVYIFGGDVQHNVFGGAYGNGLTVAIPIANVTMTGGLVEGGVYGGSNSNGAVGDVTIQIDGGQVGIDADHTANVHGGGLGELTLVTGNINLSLGTNGQTAPGVTVYGDVYGGSALGQVNATGNINVQNNTLTNVNYNNGKYTNVTLNAGVVHGNVYGGALGDHESLGTGHSDVPANVYGPVTVIVNGGSAENIFGCNNINGAPQRAVDVTVNGGEVMQNVYGGGNVAAYTFARGPVVVINGGTIDQDVFGGGNLADVTGNTHVTVNGGTIVQDVYGGGALAHVGTSSSNTTLVDILGGTIQRAVYGGGLGRKAADGVSAIAAVVRGEVTVNIGTGNESNTTLHFSNDATGDATLIGASVFGGNNVNGTPLGNVTVNIWGTAHTDDNVQSNTNGSYAIANVFGGGNESDYKPTLSGAECVVHIYSCANTIQRTFGGGNAAATPTATTTIQGGRFGQVFGGGNGERGPEYGANVGYDDDDNDGDVIVDIHGGLVKEFYGGSNQNGVIQGSINIDVDNESGCGLDADEFFCGGNFVDIIGGLTTTILCSDGMEIANLYGGCNQAEISGDVVLNVYGGIYTNVFGGSKGRLPGTNGPDDEGISADIHGRVFLNLYGGTIENVFGGSNVRGNIDDRIVVNVLDVEGPCPLYITNIYGGSNLTSYTPENATITSPLVNVVHAKYGISGNVFGGSKGLVDIPATVNANPRVNLGYDSDMIDNTNNTYLGTYVYDYSALLQSPRSIVAGSVFGGCDAAQVIGNTAVYLRNRSKVFGNVYGGGNMGEVTGNTLVIVNGANQ